MIVSNIEDLIYLRDSKILLNKIEEIKNTIRNMGCTIKENDIIPSGIYIEDNMLRFNTDILFELPYRFFDGKLNTEPGENLSPDK